MVNKSGIAFDSSIHSQIASKASICDFSVLQYLDRSLDPVDSWNSHLQ